VARNRRRVRADVTPVTVAVVDVAGVYFFFIVVDFRLMGAGLAKDLTAQRVGEEGFHIGRIRGNHEVQQVRCGRVVGDEICGGVADAKIEYLHTAGPFPGGHLAGALGNLVGVVRAGHEDADRPVKHLVHTIQHQILVMRGQYCGRDLVAAAKY
jgi:hypothetical protein